MSVNKVILVGNAGKDPEVRYLENGTPVCTFSLATSETYTNKSGEKVTNTEWHNIVMWRGLAESAQKWVKKGSTLYVEGKIRSRSWDDKDGNKRYTTEIVADTFKFVGRKPDDGQSHAPAHAQHESKPVSEADSFVASNEPADDLPF
jgi:single-strand DNA-binding protein